ncbi:MAG: HesA/MoeB/ThiF family protein [Candidatus Melainabacteria bacterium]|nr:HesA/MoeB/ThiF family protein [Candidatus Melainabacteria bacterium]
MKLTDEQLEHYSRQIILPEIGASGQKKLLSSKVLVLGAGGLGSAVLCYLASSGIGTIGIVDSDKVDLSNLHRQIIHSADDLKKSKVISAKEKINKLNSDVRVVTYETKLDKHNIEKIFGDFEVIIDGFDNFKDKFLVNDYCISLNKKLVHAGVVGFEGQILTVVPGKSACLRCYFPYDEPDDFRQSCKEIGVLGTCVGVLSTLQANEVLKLVLGIGEPYTNRVLKYNALDGKFYEFKIAEKNKDCPVCKTGLLQNVN